MCRRNDSSACGIAQPHRCTDCGGSLHPLSLRGWNVSHRLPLGAALPIYGHERIVGNIARAAGEIGPAYARGLVQQFGTALPLDGADGIVNVGLGLYYRNPAHRPFTPGFIPPTKTLRGGEVLTVAGLRVETAFAPSDADDSLTYWFPELGVCVQNNVWPAVFNVYAIRGEEYRNPQNMLPGIDHVLSLNPEHLVCTHGPPFRGPKTFNDVSPSIAMSFN